MKYSTIVFTDANNKTAGIMAVDQDGAIARHAHEQGKYVNAYLFNADGFQRLHHDPAGMDTQDAIDRLDAVLGRISRA